MPLPKSLVELFKAADAIALDIAFANSPLEPGENGGDNQRARMKAGVALEAMKATAEAAIDSCPAAVGEIRGLQSALNNSIHHRDPLTAAADARLAIEIKARQGMGSVADSADSKADSPKNYPRSERVFKAVTFVNDYHKRVAAGKAPHLSRIAILSEHLGEPVNSEVVKNLARQVRKYHHMLLPVEGNLADS